MYGVGLCSCSLYRYVVCHLLFDRGRPPGPNGDVVEQSWSKGVNCSETHNVTTRVFVSHKTVMIGKDHCCDSPPPPRCVKWSCSAATSGYCVVGGLYYHILTHKHHHTCAHTHAHVETITFSTVCVVIHFFLLVVFLMQNCWSPLGSDRKVSPHVSLWRADRPKLHPRPSRQTKAVETCTHAHAHTHTQNTTWFVIAFMRTAGV